MVRDGSKPFRGPLTRHMVQNARVIARGRRIGDRKRLVRSYGGHESEWMKMSSPTYNDGKQDYQVHWYEHPTLGVPAGEKKKKFLNSP